MNRIFALLLICMYLPGLFGNGPATAFGLATKITITHSHEVSDHDHDHHHEADLEHHHDQATDSDSKDSESTSEHQQHSEHQHSHEFFVAASALYFSAPRQPDLNITKLEPTFPDSVDQRAPHEPARNSIFRPPIA